MSFDAVEVEATNCSRFGEFETIAVSNGFGVVSSRSYFWHHAQVCMSLARATDDPVLKHRYQDLALEFAQNAGDERDRDITVSSRAALKPKPGSGSTSTHE